VSNTTERGDVATLIMTSPLHNAYKGQMSKEMRTPNRFI